MKQGIVALVFGAVALTAASAASARVNVSIGINPFGYGAYAPPVVYQPDPYYAAPPVVYFGGGSWAGDRGRRSGGHARGGRRR
jgi:hypothetical protein